MIMTMQEKIKSTYDIVKTAMLILIAVIGYLAQQMISDIKSSIAEIKTAIQRMDSTNDEQSKRLDDLSNQIRNSKPNSN